MKLSVSDISNDLGCCKVTVCRWIRSGELKATKNTKGPGWASWEIDSDDYDIFLNKNQKLRMIHNDEIYGRTIKTARADICNSITAELSAIAKTYESLIHSKEYQLGWNEAMKQCVAIIEKERRKMVCS